MKVKEKKVPTNERTNLSKKQPKDRNVQSLNSKGIYNFIPIVKNNLHEDGMIEFQPASKIKNKNSHSFSKMYSFVDANFVTETEVKQEEILLKYQKILNLIPDDFTIQFIIVNEKLSKKQMQDMYFIKLKGDAYDDLRIDYNNNVIKSKIDEGHNNIRKQKYFILSVTVSDNKIEAAENEARLKFNSLEMKLQENFKTINGGAGFRCLNLWERMNVMYYILNSKEEDSKLSFDSLYSKFCTENGAGEKTVNLSAMKRANMNVRKMISPEVIAKDRRNGTIQLGENRFCRSMQVLDFISSTASTDFLTRITNTPCEMVTFISFVALDKKKAKALVKNKNTSIKSDMIDVYKKAAKNGVDPNLVMNEDLVAESEEARKLRTEVMQEGKKLFLTTMISTVFGETTEDLKINTDQLKLRFSDEGLKATPLIGEQEPALKTSMLTGGEYLYQDRLLTSDGVVALQPFNIQEMNEPGGSFYGTNGISLNMIFCDRRRLKPVANGLTFGRSGSGKSVSNKLEMIATLLNSDDKIICLDPENEYRPLVEVGHFDGVIFDLKTKSEFHINPCDMNMEYGEKDADPLTEKCDYMVSLVEAIMGKGRECNAYEVNAIHRATTSMYEPYIREMDRRREEGNAQNIDTSICPTLVDFYKQLVSESSVEAQKIANQIEPYCVGNYNIFAHRTNVDTSKRLIIYNLASLPDKMKEFAMKVCLSSVWTEITKNREDNAKYNRSRYVWVYMDEFHLFFQTESSASTIQAYYKRVRKYNGIMTGITQDVADLVRTPQGQGMFNNTGFFTIFNQLPAGQAAVQRTLNVSDSVLDYIADKPRGSGIFVAGKTTIPISTLIPTDSKIFEIVCTSADELAKKKEKEERELAEKELEEANKSFSVQSRNSLNETKVYEDKTTESQTEEEEDEFF